MHKNNFTNQPQVLYITSYPPRECGIASYSQDLIKALANKYDNSFTSSICALESDTEVHTYGDEVKFVLDTSDAASYLQCAEAINASADIRIVMIQHEFGLFDSRYDEDFLHFLSSLNKPVIITYHTVLPRPDAVFKRKVEEISARSSAIIVMTQHSADILVSDYRIPAEKISVIPHGVHLVPHSNKKALKEKYGLSGRTILSTFGLISSGKSIETTLDALPDVIKNEPGVLFLVIGKTHPNVVKHEGERYRNQLLERVEKLGLQDHVRFVNYYLPLEELLEYLQLTDIYLFTSRDPNQAVSGTFSYAISCGCPIISTPIPHAKEVLKNDAGIIFDFGNSDQLASAVNRLLADENLRDTYSNNGLQRIVSSAWQNVSISHANLFKKHDEGFDLRFRIPEIKLDFVKHLTTDFGIIQFSKIDAPDITSGYTLDDNARALVAMVMDFALSGDRDNLPYISLYLHFIKFCQQQDGDFLNYVDEEKNFTPQNAETNLEDSNGRALWALGILISHRDILPESFIDTAYVVFDKALRQTTEMHSTRAMAFSLKGLCYYNRNREVVEHLVVIETLAARLAEMYKHEGELSWEWFESYLTYGNSILPESLLCAYEITHNIIYKEIAQCSFAFLLKQTFDETGIKVISNQEWLKKGGTAARFGEQPIDVAYTILALDRFYQVFKDEAYLDKMNTAFDWFLGRNHLKQIIYNPCTGGCYDGLEEHQINLNQGAESTVSYLMARLTVEKYRVEATV
ncbi:glycosyltransferase [Arcticibacter sp.]|uniref:glycosyltransferase n=1 Tax=Arcticibacter sp. TaxID=1872630 RepID=UPI00388FD301